MPTLSADAVKHSQNLINHIAYLIKANNGEIPFDQYMRAILYTPGLGYYQSGNYKIGAAGDFITAPEISHLFGQCIAVQLQSILATLHNPVIFELGAGSGKMAADMLLKLQDLDSLPTAYWILEPSPDLQARQKQFLTDALPHFIHNIHWLSTLPEHPFNGVIIGNEVLDALPVKRFKIHHGKPCELNVGFDGNQFYWKTGTPIGLNNLVNPEWPEGFTSEINTQLQPWLASITDNLQQGAVLFFDYGYAAREYYQPDRTMGTLMCYYQHRRHDDPFVYPGLQDITAHVNFTAVAEAGVDCGLTLQGYTTQALFLAINQIEKLVQQWLAHHPDDELKIQAQTRQLLLPQEMGDLVKVIALSKRYDEMNLSYWRDISHTL